MTLLQTTESASNVIRLLIIDDHEMLRLGLKTLFRKSSAIRVIGEAATLATALTETARLQPDVILLDIGLPDGNGAESCQALRNASPASRILILTSFVDDGTVLSAILSGADGYVLKEIGRHALIEAIMSVARGQSILDPSITRAMLDQLRSLARQDQQGQKSLLSKQEHRVLSLITEGKTNKEIAVALDLSDKTIKSYLSNIYAKLNVTRRTQAAALFIKRPNR